MIKNNFEKYLKDKNINIDDLKKRKEDYEDELYWWIGEKVEKNIKEQNMVEKTYFDVESWTIDLFNLKEDIKTEIDGYNYAYITDEKDRIKKSSSMEKGYIYIVMK
jgi:hypothetical protein